MPNPATPPRTRTRIGSSPPQGPVRPQAQTSLPSSSPYRLPLRTPAIPSPLTASYLQTEQQEGAGAGQGTGPFGPLLKYALGSNGASGPSFPRPAPAPPPTPAPTPDGLLGANAVEDAQTADFEQPQIGSLALEDNLRRRNSADEAPQMQAERETQQGKTAPWVHKMAHATGPVGSPQVETIPSGSSVPVTLSSAPALQAQKQPTTSPLTFGASQHTNASTSPERLRSSQTDPKQTVADGHGGQDQQAARDRITELYLMSERERGLKLDRIVSSGLMQTADPDSARKRFINDALLSQHYGMHRAELKEGRSQRLLDVARNEFGFQGASIKDGEFFNLARKRLRDEKEMKRYLGMDQVNGIPVNPTWNPKDETLNSTLRIGDYPWVGGDFAMEQMEKWKSDFRATYGHMAVNAAWKNTVPARLLTTLSANEMAASDWGELDAAADESGVGTSYGPLQITEKTALKEGAADTEKDQHKFLNRPGYNFDVGGRLMHTYLARLADDVATGRYKAYSNSFKSLSGLNMTRSQIYDDLKTIREGDPKKVFTLRPGDDLVRAMAAIWNNGFDIVQVENIPTTASNASAHAGNASVIYKDVDDMMPVFRR